MFDGGGKGPRGFGLEGSWLEEFAGGDEGEVGEGLEDWGTGVTGWGGFVEGIVGPETGGFSAGGGVGITPGMVEPEDMGLPGDEVDVGLLIEGRGLGVEVAVEGGWEGVGWFDGLGVENEGLAADGAGEIDGEG